MSNHNLPKDKIKQIRPVNTPDYEYDKYSKEYLERYSEILIQSIKEEGVHNIGVSGPYGSGKTTIMNDVLEKFPEIKSQSVNISLGSYDTSEDTDSGKIQKEILQQIFAQAKENELSGLVIRKLKKYSLTKRILASILFSALFIVATYIASPIFKFEYNKSDIPLFSLILLLISSIPFLPYLSIKNLEFQGIKVEIAESGSETFSTYFQEIEFFIKNSSKKYFFFEDLDRFNDSSIFSDLKNLNASLNYSIRSEKKPSKVVFIYLVGDDFLELGDANTTVSQSLRRNKFFDISMPVIPYNTKFRPWEYLENRLGIVNDDEKDSADSKVQCEDKYQDFRKIAQIYLHDIRTVKHIVNEVITYQYTNSEISEESDIELLKKGVVYFTLKHLLPCLFLYNQRGTYNLVELFNAFRDAQEKSLREKNKSSILSRAALDNKSLSMPDFKDFDNFIAFIKDNIAHANGISQDGDVKKWIELYKNIFSDQNQESLFISLVTKNIINEGFDKYLDSFLPRTYPLEPRGKRKAANMSSEVPSQNADSPEIRDDESEIEEVKNMRAIFYEGPGSANESTPAQIIKKIKKQFSKPGLLEVSIAEEMFAPAKGFESLYLFYLLLYGSALSDSASELELKKILRDAYIFTKNNFVLQALLQIVCEFPSESIISSPNEIFFYKDNEIKVATYSELSLGFTQKSDGKDTPENRIYLPTGKIIQGKEKEYDMLFWVLTDNKNILIVAIDSILYKRVVDSDNFKTYFLSAYEGLGNSRKIVALDYNAIYSKLVPQIETEPDSATINDFIYLSEENESAKFFFI